MLGPMPFAFKAKRFTYAAISGLVSAAAQMGRATVVNSSQLVSCFTRVKRQVSLGHFWAAALTSPEIAA